MVSLSCASSVPMADTSPTPIHPPTPLLTTTYVSPLPVRPNQRLWVGGVAEWPFTVCKKQTFTYAPDCGKALAALALTNDCYNQVRGPTARPAFLCHIAPAPPICISVLPLSNRP